MTNATGPVVPVIPNIDGQGTTPVQVDGRKLLSFRWLDPHQPLSSQPAVEIHVRLDPADAQGRARIRSELGQALFAMLAQLDLEGTTKP